MDTYQKYDHTISEESLLQVLREAASHGCASYVVINGEYYTVKLDSKKIHSVDPEDLF